MFRKCEQGGDNHPPARTHDAAQFRQGQPWAGHVFHHLAVQDARKPPLPFRRQRVDVRHHVDAVAGLHVDAGPLATRQIAVHDPPRFVVGHAGADFQDIIAELVGVALNVSADAAPHAVVRQPAW